MFRNLCVDVQALALRVVEQALGRAHRDFKRSVDIRVLWNSTAWVRSPLNSSRLPVKPGVYEWVPRLPARLLTADAVLAQYSDLVQVV